MKKKLKIAFTILISSLTILSCHRDVDSIDQTEMIKAKSWFEANITQIKAPSPNKSDKIVYKPDWDKAKLSIDQGLESIEVPLLFKDGFGFCTPESKTEYDNTGNMFYLESETRLVIQESKERPMYGFLMTIVPEKSFRDVKRNTPIILSYKKMSEFSGYVLYHNFDGVFVNGWKYLNGVPLKTVAIKENGDLNVSPTVKSSQLQEVCYDYYLTRWFSQCTDWYADPDHTIYQNTTCTVYSTTDLITRECEYIGAGGEGGGGGGGSIYYQAGTFTIVDPLYNPGSTLEVSQKAILESAMTQFKNRSPFYSKVYNYFIQNNITLGFKILPSLGYPAAYSNGTIFFREVGTIMEEYLQEEMLHAYQSCIYGNLYTNSIHIEFELKVLQDVINYLSGFPSGNYGSQGLSMEDGLEYQDFIQDIVNNGNVDRFMYIYFGTRYVYPNSDFPFNGDFFPRILDSCFRIVY